MISKNDRMNMKEISGGEFIMGNSKSKGFAIDHEGPTTMINVLPFYISETTVTNQQFSIFVNETGFKTEAERLGRSFVFQGLLPKDGKEEQTIEGNEKEIDFCKTELDWWVDLEEANWKHPEGPHSSIEDRMDHPVVHITWNDARAYCEWVGGRLPTEAEWEYAARGGLKEKEYAWGNELTPDGKHYCNIWQGEFPNINTEEDGYYGTAPVKTYEPNGYGLYQVAGNVWEWCLNPARIPLDFFKRYPLSVFLDATQGYHEEYMAQRGGSFLCHHSYCNRYRVAARNGNTGNSASSNCSFRYVMDNR